MVNKAEWRYSSESAHNIEILKKNAGLQGPSSTACAITHVGEEHGPGYQPGALVISSNETRGRGFKSRRPH